MDQRSQKRIQASIAVKVRGVDVRGEVFEESTEALEVSRRGLSFLTRRGLPLQAPLTVVIPGLGPARSGDGPTDFLTTAAVVRVQKQGEMNLVGIRFVGTTLPTYTAENDR